VQRTILVNKSTFTNTGISTLAMSLYPIILSVLLLGLVEAEEQGGVGGVFGGRLAGIVEPRLASNAIRIVQLEKHIEKLRTRIEEAEHVDPERFVNDLRARLDHIEGNHCDAHEFQCGSDGQECISDLFVCDGHNDCHNDHDEDKDVCSTVPVKAGHVLRGLVHWTDCLLRDDHIASLNIISTRRFKFFQPRVVIHASLTTTFKNQEGEEVTREIPMHGGYNFANRRFRLFPDEHDADSPHLTLTCEFDHGDDERTDCFIETELTQHKCASVHLTLEHDDEDDD